MAAAPAACFTLPLCLLDALGARPLSQIAASDRTGSLTATRRVHSHPMRNSVLACAGGRYMMQTCQKSCRIRFCRDLGISWKKYAVGTYPIEVLHMKSVTSATLSSWSGSSTYSFTECQLLPGTDSTISNPCTSCPHRQNQAGAKRHAARRRLHSADDSVRAGA